MHPHGEFLVRMLPQPGLRPLVGLIGRTLELAFDHDKITALAVERVRGKIDFAPLAFELVPPTFTISELRAVYEAIKGTDYDPGNFRRRFMRMQTDGVIEQAPGKRQTGTKPARVYRFVGAGQP